MEWGQDSGEDVADGSRNPGGLEEVDRRGELLDGGGLPVVSGDERILIAGAS